MFNVNNKSTGKTSDGWFFKKKTQEVIVSQEIYTAAAMFLFKVILSTNWRRV